MGIDWNSPRAIPNLAREIPRELEDVHDQKELLAALADLPVQIHDRHGWIDMHEHSDEGEQAPRQG